MSSQQPLPQTAALSSGPSLQSNSSRTVDLPQAPSLLPGNAKSLELISSAAEKVPGEAALLDAMKAPEKKFSARVKSAEALLKHYPRSDDVQALSGKRIAFLENLISHESLTNPACDTLLAMMAHPELMTEKSTNFLQSTLDYSVFYGASLERGQLVQRLWQLVQEKHDEVPVALGASEMIECSKFLGMKEPTSTTITDDRNLALDLQRLIDSNQPINIKDVQALGMPFSTLVDPTLFSLARIKKSQSALGDSEKIPFLIHTLATSPVPVPFATRLLDERLKGLQNWVERLFNPATAKIPFQIYVTPLEVLISDAAVESRKTPGITPNSPEYRSKFAEILRRELGTYQEVLEDGGYDRLHQKQSAADDFRTGQAMAEIAAVEEGIKRSLASAETLS